MIRQGACMHASTFEVCFIYHQGLSVIAKEALTDCPFRLPGWTQCPHRTHPPIATTLRAPTQ